MKVVFLDIDGVLNSVRSCIAYDGYPWQGDTDEEREWHKFDQVAIALLRVLVRESGAVCVLSSTWRLGREDFTPLEEVLGVPIVGKTRDTVGEESRGEEIDHYLKKNKDVTSYVILDDDVDMLPYQMERFVWVDPHIGLTHKEVYECLNILS